MCVYSGFQPLRKQLRKQLRKWPNPTLCVCVCACVCVCVCGYMPLTFSVAAQHAHDEHAHKEHAHKEYPAGEGKRSHREHTAAGAGSATSVANRQLGSGGSLLH